MYKLIRRSGFMIVYNSSLCQCMDFRHGFTVHTWYRSSVPCRAPKICARAVYTSVLWILRLDVDIKRFKFLRRPVWPLVVATTAPLQNVFISVARRFPTRLWLSPPYGQPILERIRYHNTLSRNRNHVWPGTVGLVLSRYVNPWQYLLSRVPTLEFVLNRSPNKPPLYVLFFFGMIKIMC